MLEKQIIHPFRGAFTLFKKEIMRFWRVSFQTVAAPVMTALLYLLVFSHVLSRNEKIQCDLINNMYICLRLQIIF